MKRLGKIVAFAVLVVGLLVVAGITLTVGWRPFFGARARTLTNRTFERTPERLARGKYLVEAVAGCIECHSPHDWTKHDAPVVSGMEGAGQDMLLLKGLPGHVAAPNLTPDPDTGTGNWSDDALARAIREGIGHDGRALFPFMPYTYYRKIPDEDLASIVVYIRSLSPVRNPLPKTQIIFPVNYLIRNAPEPITEPLPRPDLTDPVARGAFLVNLATCSDCHTPQERGRPLQGLEFAGGLILEGPWGRIGSSNITPDPSGIPYYDEALFIESMRTGYVKARKLNQIMPWMVFRNMTDGDLKAVFSYLKTLKPVRHRIDNSEAPSYCPACKMTHGAGKLNTGG